MKRMTVSMLCFLAACSSTPERSEGNDGGVDGAREEDSTTSDVGHESGDSGFPVCQEAKDLLLGPIAATSTGEVTVLAEIPGGKLVYIDASAGGTQASLMNPRIYVALSTLTKVDVTDITAASSVAWDLAIKRPILFTNGGHGGPGQGGSVFLADKDFETVTHQDAKAAVFPTERFLDEGCNPLLDATGSVKTSFDDWYDYDQTTNQVTPRRGTWLVRGGMGLIYKVEIASYYATPDGGVGQSGGRYTMRVGAI